MNKSIVPVNQIAVRSPTDYEFSNPNPAEVVEIEDDPVETMERGIEDLKLNNHKNHVPLVFQNLIKEQMDDLDDLDDIQVSFCREYCTLKIDKIRIRLQKIEDYWLMIYKNGEETVKVDDPEKSIIDHLHFVLKNPKIQLENFEMSKHFYPETAKHFYFETKKASIDSGKIDNLLQSMFESIDHQIHTEDIWLEGFSDDMFLLMLKHFKPKVLKGITFCFPYERNGNNRKLKKEIVGTEQWKRAKGIHSFRNFPLQFDDLLHYDEFTMLVDTVTPDDVLRVIKHFFNSTVSRKCWLSGRLDIDAIISTIRSQNDGSQITEKKLQPTQFLRRFSYLVVKYGKSLSIQGDQLSLEIEKD